METGTVNKYWEGYRPWGELESHPDYMNAEPMDQMRIRHGYFQRFIQPSTPFQDLKAQDDETSIKEEYLSTSQRRVWEDFVTAGGAAEDRRKLVEDEALESKFGHELFATSVVAGGAAAIGGATGLGAVSAFTKGAVETAAGWKGIEAAAEIASKGVRAMGADPGGIIDLTAQGLAMGGTGVGLSKFIQAMLARGVYKPGTTPREAESDFNVFRKTIEGPEPEGPGRLGGPKPKGPEPTPGAAPRAKGPSWEDLMSQYGSPEAMFRAEGGMGKAARKYEAVRNWAREGIRKRDTTDDAYWANVRARTEAKTKETSSTANYSDVEAATDMLRAAREAAKGRRQRGSEPNQKRQSRSNAVSEAHRVSEENSLNRFSEQAEMTTTTDIPPFQDTPSAVEFGMANPGLSKVLYQKYNDNRNQLRASKDAGTLSLDDYSVQVQLNQFNREAAEAAGDLWETDPETGRVRYKEESIVERHFGELANAGEPVDLETAFNDVVNSPYIESPSVTKARAEELVGRKLTDPFAALDAFRTHLNYKQMFGENPELGITAKGMEGAVEFFQSSLDKAAEQMNDFEFETYENEVNGVTKYYNSVMLLDELGVSMQKLQEAVPEPTLETPPEESAEQVQPPIQEQPPMEPRGPRTDLSQERGPEFDKFLAQLKEVAKGMTAEDLDVSGPIDPADIVEPFYSHVERAIDELPDNITARSVVNQIRKQPGVRQSELDWYGIEAWLEGKGRVTKAQIQKFIEDNKIELSVGKRAQDDPIDDATQDIRFMQWTMQGGENYREFLVIKELSQAEENLDMSEYGYGFGGELHDDPNYYEPHFEVENVVGHALIKDRTSLDGKKMMFLEEVQSEWAKVARAGSYPGGPGIRALELTMSNAENRLAELDQFIKEHTKEFGDIPPDADIRDMIKYPEGMDSGTFEMEYERASLAAREARGAYAAAKESVPDMPFKEDWYEVVLKSLLREAAEGNYDRLAWPEGQIIINRYSGMSQDIAHSKWPIELYDHIIPSFLKKYGKRWDAKVGKTEIHAGHHDEYPLDMPVHYIEITPEMKRSLLLKGQAVIGPTLESLGMQSIYEWARDSSKAMSQIIRDTFTEATPARQAEYVNPTIQLKIDEIKQIFKRFYGLSPRIRRLFMEIEESQVPIGEETLRQLFIEGPLKGITEEQARQLTWNREQPNKYPVPEGLDRAARYVGSLLDWMGAELSSRKLLGTFPESALNNIDKITATLERRLNDAPNARSRRRINRKLSDMAELRAEVAQLKYVPHTLSEVYTKKITELAMGGRRGPGKLSSKMRRFIRRKALTLDEFIEATEELGVAELDVRILLADYINYGMNQIVRYDKIEELKTIPEYVLPRVQAPKTWLKVPEHQLKGYRVHPLLGNAIQEFTAETAKRDVLLKGYDAINRLGKFIVFYNPAIMTINDISQIYAGGALLSREMLRTTLGFLKKDFDSSVNDVVNQTELYRAVQLKGGFSSPAKPRETMIQVAKMWLAHEKSTKPEFWKNLEKSIGRSITPENFWRVDQVGKMAYDLIWEATWKMDRIWRMTAVRNFMNKGMSLPQAVDRMNRIMVQYTYFPNRTRVLANRIFLTPTYRGGQIRLYGSLIRHPLEKEPLPYKGVSKKEIPFAKRPDKPAKPGDYSRENAKVISRMLLNKWVVGVVGSYLGYQWLESYRLSKRGDKREEIITLPGPLFEIEKVLGRPFTSSLYTNMARIPYMVWSLARNRDWKGDQITTFGRAPDFKNEGEATLWAKEFFGWMIRTYLAPLERIDAMTEDEVEGLNGILGLLGTSKYTRRDPSVQWSNERGRAQTEYHKAWWPLKEEVMIAHERNYSNKVIQERKDKMNKIKIMAANRRDLQIARIDKKYAPRLNKEFANPAYFNHPLRQLWVDLGLDGEARRLAPHPPPSVPPAATPSGRPRIPSERLQELNL